MMFNMGENFAELIHKETKKQETAPLFVSLYIVLLAFFIMLNTIASYRKDKSDEILESVKLTFAYHKPTDFEQENAPSDQSGSTIEQFSSAMEQHSERFLSLDTLEISQTGDMVQVDIPHNVMFDENNAIAPKTRQFLQATAQSMKDWRRGFDVRLEALVDTPPLSVIVFYQGGTDETALKYAGTIARFMEKTPIEPHQLSIGLRQSKAKKTALRFTIHPIEVTR